ncbi:MAG: DUF3990 domain-containing protein [Spirochaetia bacterium]|jgi:hypothetical protein|nr:DUF3990 domain-containing protein [Spirochaetia bacterium]
MILYHGSYVAIEKPDLSLARLRTDFGKGFYLTPLKEQAVSWSRHFIAERGSAVVSAYDFLTKVSDKLPKNAKILEFDTHSLEWLNFVTANRLNKPVKTKWDLVIGGVANDKVFDTLRLYFDNLIDADEAIKRLRYNKPNFQYCFKNQKLIDKCLRFIGAEVIM